MQCRNCRLREKYGRDYCAKCKPNTVYQEKTGFSWNWWAFFFGPLWYLYQGFVGRGIIAFSVTIILNLVGPGLGTLLTAVYCGLQADENLQCLL